mgnify:CR=1 FL=1
MRIQNIRQQKLGSDNVYQYLLYFDKLYDKFTDAEKKEFLSSFVERVDIYEDELPDGRFLRHIKFKFPVFYNGQEIDEMSWDKEVQSRRWRCWNIPDRIGIDKRRRAREPEEKGAL